MELNDSVETQLQQCPDLTIMVYRPEKLDIII